MQYSRTIKATLAALTLACATGAQAQTATFDFNYLASGLYGPIATKVATVTFTDIVGSGTYSDALGATQSYTNGGVRADFTAYASGLAQFANPNANTGATIYISSFETNFPNTSTCNNVTCSSTSVANGYDTLAAGGYGNQWSQGAGASFTTNAAGGVEWAENGQNNGWGIGATDVGFGQENNWGTNNLVYNVASGTFTTSNTSSISWFNFGSRNDISVANILANPVYRTVGGTATGAIDTTRPAAFSWIKVRSTGLGIANGAAAANGFTAETNAAGGRLNILAVQAVPEPDTYAMMLAGLGLMGFIARRRSSK